MRVPFGELQLLFALRNSHSLESRLFWVSEACDSIFFSVGVAWNALIGVGSKSPNQPTDRQTGRQTRGFFITLS